MSADPLRNAILDLEAQLSQCKAERQQAGDERDAVMAAGRELERQRDHATEVTASLRARCEQAIDALRDAKNCVENGDNATALEIIDAALLNLGEQP